MGVGGLDVGVTWVGSDCLFVGYSMLEIADGDKHYSWFVGWRVWDPNLPSFARSKVRECICVEEEVYAKIAVCKIPFCNNHKKTNLT